MKKLMVCAALVFSSASFAALPPLYQSQRELMSVLQNNEVLEKLGSGSPIDGIIRNEKGYSVLSKGCTLQVDVIYLPLPDGMVGPAKYKLEVADQLVCPSE